PRAAASRRRRFANGARPPGRREVIAAMPADLPRPRLTVVLPVYDELASLEGAIDRYRDALATLGLADSELLVVDDGSRDGTGERAESLAAALDAAASPGPRLRVLRHQRNQGQVAALR